MKRRDYEFRFHRTFVLHRPLWVYVTTALSVVCAVVAVVLRFA
ncbi:MAG TPA: hypothetical protein VH081_07050 [Solirubrobacteraceae bacterium]|jgi:hypothetical protein|nr:hypothetical protein [Solirubrobacteraceae bacterium]